MRVFLAGGISGNLNPLWKTYAQTGDMEKSLQVYLAGTESRQFVFTQGKNEDMKVFLAANWSGTDSYVGEIKKQQHPYILESFYYSTEQTEKLIPYFSDFLLDSGAFTFMSNSKTAVEWDPYIDRYAAFVKRNNIKKYLELDIDSLVGYEQVKKYRAILEKKVGWQCIPVWHKSRGIEEWKKMCQDYSYVAIGGIVTKEITPDQYKAFPAMISYAHKHGCKVHGLGFTRLTALHKYHFDSVDSTAWTTGNRFGYAYKFDNGNMLKIDKPVGKKIASSRELAINNFNEWVKYQRWAETHL